MPQTYLFYDIETSGLSKCFDQVLQFAAIRTDMELHELERHEILIKLNPDVIPAPQAIITHRLSLEQLACGINEYAAMREIHQLFNSPDTITIGYNTLGFDDEFLRFSFHRNLLPPYTHQFANGCHRADLYPIAVVYHLFKPEIINWPKIEDKHTFKLEHLSAHNKLAEGNAHEAMTDVCATLQLARCFIKARDMWDYLLGYFDKNTDIARWQKLPTVFANYPQTLLIDGSFGAGNFYQRPVIGLGQHNHYKNQSLWLALDSAELIKTLVTTIPDTTRVLHKKFGEAPIMLPPEKRFLRHLSSARQELATANLQWLENNPEIFREIVHYHKEYTYTKIPELDIDAALYQNGFLSEYEALLCHDFHEASPVDKINLLDKFTNANLREQALRILGRNYAEILPVNLAQEFAQYRMRVFTQDEKKVMVDYRNEPRLSLPKALHEINKLKQSLILDSAQQKLLRDLEEYLLSKI